jgi:HlyD family secretion protein
VLATVALATVVVAFLAFQPKPVIVDTALVERRDLASSIDADGRTRVRHRFVIEAPVGGRVERLALAEGALVRAGDVVARILPMPLDSQAVAQATARVNAALAIALEAGANMRTAAADLEFRRRELDRARRLLDAGGIAPRVVEEQTVAWVRAEEAVHAAEQRARAADADVEQARSLLFPLDPARGRPVLLRAFVRPHSPGGGA